MPSHKHKHRGIGIMTGTSLDGVDLVEATFSHAPPMGLEGAEPAPRWVFSIDRAETVPLPDAWRNQGVLETVRDVLGFRHSNMKTPKSIIHIQVNEPGGEPIGTPRRGSFTIAFENLESVVQGQHIDVSIQRKRQTAWINNK